MKKNCLQITAWSSALLLSAAAHSAFAVTFDTDTTFSSAPTWNENVTISSGATVTLGENILIGQTQDITIDIDGSLVMNNTKTDNHAAGNALINANNQALQFTGSGTFVKTGSGRLAAQSSGYTGADGYSIKFAMEDGALIDIQQGTFVNGGWNQQNWNDNKADLQIASGANLDIWDGTNMKVDSLVGSGTVTSGSTAARWLDIGRANSTWLVDGAQQTPEFTGTFASGKNISVCKYGTGTQILSGAFLSTGYVQVADGTLQIGNGTNGYIGTDAIVNIYADKTLVFNTNQLSSLRQAVTVAGTLDIQKGTVEIINVPDVTGAVKVASGAHLALGSAVALDKFTIADGSTLSLYVSSTDTTGFTLDTFNAEKTARPNTTVQLFAPTGKTLTSADTGDYLKGTTSIGVQVADGGTLLFDNGADSVTTIGSSITNTGSAVIGSGKVVVNSATPAAGNARFALPQITVNDGATLVYDNIVPQQAQAMTFTINKGGVLEFARTGTPNAGTNETIDKALSSGSGVVTVNGAGTLRVTGQDYLYTANGNVNFVMAMATGGLLDIQGGEFVNGGYSSQTWSGNKGSVNIAEGAAFNLWNGSDVYIDGLTGKGNVIRGTRWFVLGQDNHSAFENQTALFEGILCGSAKHVAEPGTASAVKVRKVGTGTQILAGENNYSGVTEVQAGTLQFGNGGATGKIGTGSVDLRGGELKFNTTRENTLTTLNGYGTLTNANSGKVTTTANPEDFRGTINAETENAVIEFSPEEFASAEIAGSITGKGTVIFNTNTNTNLKMASTPVSEGTTLQINGGNVSVGSGLFNGTLKTTDNVTLTMPQNNTGSPYTMTLYEDQADATGAITPMMSEGIDVIHYDEKVFDMSQAANSGDGNQVLKYIPNDYAALSYTNTITVLKDLTLDFTGQFDDTQGVWVKPLNADGTEIEGAEWQTLLNYAGKCAVNTATGVTLSAGTYLLDVRVGEYSGGQVAQARDAYNDFMGIGLRLNGTSNWFNFDVNTENGFVGLLDGSIVSGTAKTDAVFDGNFDIAEGKTVTFDNPHATMEKYDIDTTVTGKGTLKFTDSADSGVEFDVNIDSEGSLVFADGVNLGLTVDLAALDTPVTAENVTFEGNNTLNVYLAGEAPEDIEMLTLIETPNTDTLTGLTLDGVNIFAEDDDLRWFTELTNGSLMLTLGNTNSLPEPATWVLLIAGAFGILKLRRKQQH